MWNRIINRRPSFHINHNPEQLDWQAKLLRLAIDAWVDHVGICQSKGFTSLPQEGPTLEMQHSVAGPLRPFWPVEPFPDTRPNWQPPEHDGDHH